MNHYIYLITNKLNGKKYIGKRSTKKEIEQDNYMGSGTLLRLAFKKYGRDNFTKDILGVCDTAKEAFEVEELLVCQDVVDSNEFYNMKIGGLGGCICGAVKSQEAKNKISIAQKERKRMPLSDEHKRKISDTQKDKKMSDETRKKMSDSAKLRKPFSDEHKRHLSEFQKGRKKSDETKRKLSEASLRRYNKISEK